MTNPYFGKLYKWKKFRQYSFMGWSSGYMFESFFKSMKEYNDIINENNHYLMFLGTEQQMIAARYMTFWKMLLVSSKLDSIRETILVYPESLKEIM